MRDVANGGVGVTEETGWSGVSSSGSGSGDSLRDRYVERTLEKILKATREPSIRPLDYAILGLLVLTLAVAMFRQPKVTATADPGVQSALTELKKQNEALAAQNASLLKQVNALMHRPAPAVAWTHPTQPAPTPVVPHPTPSAVVEPTVVARPVASPSHPVALQPPSHTLTAPAADRIHVLEPGESLWSVCDHYYADPKLLGPLAQYNGIQDPTRVKVGTPIKIPAEARLKAPTPPNPPPATMQ